MMSRRQHIKSYIYYISAISSIISFIVSIILILCFFKSDLEIRKLTPIEYKIFFASYITFFLFLMFLIFLVLLTSIDKLFRKCLDRLLGLKGSFSRYIFIFWLLIVIYFGWVLGLTILLDPTLPTSVLIPFYLLLAITVFLIHHWIKKDQDNRRLILATFVAFISLIVTYALFKILFERYVVFFAKENLLKTTIFIILAISIGEVFYLFSYKLILRTYDRINLLKKREILRTLTKVSIVCILLSFCISSYGFFWEHKIGHEKKFLLTKKSDTKKDINVILIVVDALRPDHLGSYGYTRQTSPYIDTFAKEGVLFQNCYASSTWTGLSIISMLTSLYPLTYLTIDPADKIPDIAEILQKEGYITYAYMGNYLFNAKSNLFRNFDFIDNSLTIKRIYITALNKIAWHLPFFKKIVMMLGHVNENIEFANKAIIPRLEEFKNQNFFMYLHYMDPHSPYLPPKPYNRMFPYTKGDKNSKTISLYDGEIRFSDKNINEVFKKLKQLGIDDKTLFIVVADHGEALGEHGIYGHGYSIYQEQVRVPLIMKYREGLPKGSVVEKAVRTIDIVPTILDILDIPYKINLGGISLLPLVVGGEGADFYENIFIDEIFESKNFILKGVIKNNEWKYIFTEKSLLRNVKKLGREELYNLKNDPGERNNLIEQKPAILNAMRKELDFYKKYYSSRQISVLDKESDYEKKIQIKSLGYVQ